MPNVPTPEEISRAKELAEECVTGVPAGSRTLAKLRTKTIARVLLYLLRERGEKEGR